MAALMQILVHIVLGIIAASAETETVPEYIKSQGYPIEKHSVTTASGYILGLHRIPIGKNKATKGDTNRPPVLLQHGFASSSASWVIAGSGNALGFILADAGYDVWLANSRGNEYSFNHTSLMKKKDDFEKFTDYSFHEKGVEDLPTTIDYVLRTTKRTNLTLYAHSAGVAMFYAMGSEQPGYLKKVNAVFGFAPLVFVGNTTSPAGQISAFINRLYLWPVLYKVLKPIASMIIGYLRTFSNNIMTRSFTTMPFTFFDGSAHFSGGTTSRLYHHFPEFISQKELIHLLQLVNSKKFRQFKLAVFNPKRILHVFPKQYDLKKIYVPTSLYFSNGDLFVNPSNMALFDKPFEKKPKMFFLHNRFSHYDFVFSDDAKKVYSLTYDDLKKYSNK